MSKSFGLISGISKISISTLEFPFTTAAFMMIND
jgi:hypothetical protein